MAIKILSNVLLTHNDPNYLDAHNSRDMFSNPTTINYEGQKYIISAGKSDNITIFKEDHRIYILTTNRHVEYAGLEMIDLDKWIYHEIVYLVDHKLRDSAYIPKNIFDISVRRQLKSLRQYED